MLDYCKNCETASTFRKVFFNVCERTLFQGSSIPKVHDDEFLNLTVVIVVVVVVLLLM